MTNPIVKTIAKTRMYLGRTFTWVGIANQLMVFSIFLATIEMRFNFKFTTTHLLLIYPCIIAIVIIIGWIDIRIGIWKAENEFGINNTPQLKEMYENTKSKSDEVKK